MARQEGLCDCEGVRTSDEAALRLVLLDAVPCSMWTRAWLWAVAAFAPGSTGECFGHFFSLAQLEIHSYMG